MQPPSDAATAIMANGGREPGVLAPVTTEPQVTAPPPTATATPVPTATPEPVATPDPTAATVAAGQG
jgi:beta-lactamase class A